LGWGQRRGENAKKNTGGIGISRAFFLSRVAPQPPPPTAGLAVRRPAPGGNWKPWKQASAAGTGGAARTNSLRRADCFGRDEQITGLF
jgi:hypothetical protein